MSNRLLRFYELDRLASIVATGNSVRVVNAGGTPVCQQGGSSFAETKLLSTDTANSILTWTQGAAVKPVTYCAYGYNPIDSLPLAAGFNGEHLEAFGFYLLGRGNRGYSTHLQRFISPDRAGIFLPGNLNAYAYTSGDPINYKDPSGNWRSPIARYRDWKAGKSLVKASNDLMNKIDATVNLKYNADQEKRNDAQRARDIENLEVQIKTTNIEISKLNESMSQLDSTVIYKNSKIGIKAGYLHENYAIKASELKKLNSTLSEQTARLQALKKTQSNSELAEWKVKQNTIAIQAARNRLNHLIKEYPHLTAKAIRKMT